MNKILLRTKIMFTMNQTEVLDYVLKKNCILSFHVTWYFLSIKNFENREENVRECVSIKKEINNWYLYCVIQFTSHFQVHWII